MNLQAGSLPKYLDALITYKPQINHSCKYHMILQVICQPKYLSALTTCESSNLPKYSSELILRKALNRTIFRPLNLNYNDHFMKYIAALKPKQLSASLLHF